MENGKWGMENGEWRMENEELTMLPAAYANRYSRTLRH
jgi:hypothetical protein